MASIYDYKANIKVISTTKGDKVIATNSEIFTVIRNAIFDASEKAEKDGRDATARDYKALWYELLEKNHESEK